jgi:hypothetical protein
MALLLSVAEKIDPEEVVSKWFNILDINIADNSISKTLHRLTMFTSLIPPSKTIQYANRYSRSQESAGIIKWIF